MTHPAWIRAVSVPLTLLCCGLLAASAAAQDAARVQPRSYRVVLENDKVRVLEFTARPGIGVCGVGIHSHPGHVTVLLTPAKVRVTQNGHTTVIENKAGDAFWEPPVTHEVENYGGNEVRSLIIEVKTPGEKPR
jgi:quercetin dioxygenase-like cupin family protein